MLLGQGPLSDCYVAKDTQTGGAVCIKILPKQVFKNDRDLLDFANRLEVVAQRLNHATINSPVEFGPLGTGLCYVASPYQNYVSLRRLLRTHQVLPEKLALATIRLICKGLAQAHQMGVVHANLKPPNIVFSKRGTALTVDWSSPAVSYLDATGRLNIDPMRSSIDRGLGYLAPEVLNGKSKPLPAADMFSVGALFYYMLTGREPATGDLAAVRRIWEAGKYPKLGEQDVLYSEITIQIAHKLVEFHPEKRYESVTDLWPDLNQALGLPSL